MNTHNSKLNMDKVFCGIDFHKNTSTLCMLAQDGREVEPVTKIPTKKLPVFLSNRKDWLIGIEVTGGVNHMAEILKSQGHEVVLINPNKFRGIGIGGKKTDKRDAIALANALRLGFMPTVHQRTRFCRELKSLLTMREHLVHSRVDSMNHIRGILREYGITMPVGVESFLALAQKNIFELSTCEPIKNSLEKLFSRILELMKEEKAIEDSLKNLTKDNEDIARLQTVPGIGPITSYMMISVVDDISRFKSAKEFASYLGLTPKVEASAEKCMMGPITRSGPEMLRRYLIHGARAWMRYSPEKSKDTNRIWAERIEDRRGTNKAIVALAHRLSRIAFAILRDKSKYTKTIKNDYVKKEAA